LLAVRLDKTQVHLVKNALVVYLITKKYYGAIASIEFYNNVSTYAYEHQSLDFL
jgi:hypothetical protein